MKSVIYTVKQLLYVSEFIRYATSCSANSVDSTRPSEMPTEMLISVIQSLTENPQKAANGMRPPRIMEREEWPKGHEIPHSQAQPPFQREASKRPSTWAQCGAAGIFC